ncbi:MAG: hypothetical protein H6737_23360 [Alphaproteobacteria bacterium]|nr:hypothetical protein [Alphaproteobacteria bacterium]
MFQRFLSILLVSPLLVPDAWAQCNSMFALEVADMRTGGDCTTATFSCDSDYDGLADDQCTANEFADLVYDAPEKQPLSDGSLPTADPGDGHLIGVFLPKCVDGSDDCPGRELRCVDGTRPMYWIDPAHGDVNKVLWVFTFEGGGSCSRAPGVPGGVKCWDDYQELDGSQFVNREEMTEWMLPGAGDYQGPQLMRSEGGILRDDAIDPSPFENYNRVILSKCSYDRKNGRTIVSGYDQVCPPGLDCQHHSSDPDTATGMPENADGDSFQLDFSGRTQVIALFNHLKNSRTVTDWRTGEPVTLPALKAASQIVVAGHSGGAEGLIHNLDHIESYLQTIVIDPNLDVRGVIDARGWPTLNHMQGYRYGTDMYDENTGDDATCVPLAVNNWCLPTPVGVANRGFGADVYRPGSQKRVSADYWDMPPDASCVATMSDPLEEHRCYDSGQVLFNHLSTPFFLRQALRDNRHLGRAPDYATSSSYRWVPATYETQVRDQIETFEAERTQAVGRFAEPIYGWADPASIGIGAFMADSERHGGIFVTDEFKSVRVSTDQCVTSTSYEEALYDWLQPPFGDVFLVDGLDGATTCP